ncbi:MAG: type II toxin-antitoxin system RelE/ParE family toxin [Bacteroidota bacterium]
MADRRIVWTETAAKQRNQILRYWVQRNGSNEYALKLLDSSNQKTERIAKHPMIYREAEHPNTRVASMGHYSIYFKVDDDVVIITAFWDNRQDPKKLFDLLSRRK